MYRFNTDIIKNLWGDVKMKNLDDLKMNTMDFIMTYGWAMLVVLVCIGVLLYFGVLNPNSFIPNRCYCNDIGLDIFNKEIINGTKYIECLNITKTIDWENKKIVFNSTTKLFKCVNKTMVKI